jgi:ubiquitin-like protein Nedd8
MKSVAREGSPGAGDERARKRRRGEAHATTPVENLDSTRMARLCLLLGEVVPSDVAREIIATLYIVSLALLEAEAPYVRERVEKLVSGARELHLERPIQFRLEPRGLVQQLTLIHRKYKRGRHHAYGIPLPFCLFCQLSDALQPQPQLGELMRIVPTILPTHSGEIAQVASFYRLRVRPALTEESGFAITIRALSGRRTELLVAGDDSVLDVKHLIRQVEGIACQAMRLFFAGRELDDERTLCQCNIGRDAVIHLNLRLRGD